jgi:hypothetical protein
VERTGEAEEGAAFVGAAVCDDAAPPLADARRADKPERGVEAEEDPPEQVVREVMDGTHPHRLLPVLALPLPLPQPSSSKGAMEDRKP